MEFFRDSKLDFMKYRRFWAIFSTVMVILGIVSVFVQKKLNIGIDFTGGTQVIVKFQDAPPMEELRRELAEAGFADAQLQRFGSEGSGEVLVRAPLQGGGDEEGTGSAAQILAALDEVYDTEAGQGFDLNQRGSDALATLLFEADPDQLRLADDEAARQHYDEVAQAVLHLRREIGIFTDWEPILALDEVSPEVGEALQAQARLGAFALLGEEVVGPAIGAELRSKGIWAVVLSILGMLAYIWIRFELRFGIGAMVATVHDVLVTLGLFALLGYEFNLSTIAAFLTLVGYSVNDTVVVFDRVRENLPRSRRRPIVDVVNESLNQTLSRTVLTSGTTMLAVGSLFFLGGDVLRGFSFVLMIGIVVGTYSSIFVASALAVEWEKWFGGPRSEAAEKKPAGRSRGDEGRARVAAGGGRG